LSIVMNLLVYALDTRRTAAPDLPDKNSTQAEMVLS